MPKFSHSIVMAFVIAVVLGAVVALIMPNEQKNVVIDEISHEVIERRGIHFPSDKAQTKIIAIVDADCRHCRNMIAKTREFNDAGISITYMPAYGSSHKRAQNHAIWCSEDPKSSLESAASNPNDFISLNKDESECQIDIDAFLASATIFRLRGTPTIIFPSGRSHTGALSPTQILSIASSSNP